MGREIYLDNNATTQPLPEVRQAMMQVLDEGFGNPSSSHSAGQRAREYLFHSRESVGSLIGAQPEQIYFTSGATEANNLVLASILHREDPSRIVTTQVEHSSVVKMCQYLESQGAEVVYLPVDRLGLVDLDRLEVCLKSGADLVSIQWVNNETGVIQPVESIAELCSQYGSLFHTDAAQAVGKFRIDLASLAIDFLSLTAHKFHGPQGIGALYTANRDHLRPMLHGGEQEEGLRPGTENMPGIVGLGVAASLREMRLSEVQKLLADRRDCLESLVLSRIPDTRVNGHMQHRVCNTTNLLFSGVDGQALVARLDQVGIRCSQSSACTNQRPEPSYVLRAMGLTERDAYASIRFGVSELTTEEEINIAVDAMADLCAMLRRFEARKKPHH